MTVDVFAGETAQIVVSVTNDTGAEVALDGYVIAFLVGPITKRTGDGITVDGSSFTVTLTPAETSALLGEEASAVTWPFEAAIKSPAGAVHRVLGGDMRIHASKVTTEV